METAGVMVKGVIHLKKNTSHCIIIFISNIVN